jgi:ApbE superfamily uncharacterized protein (UPF0280 family)
MKRKRFRIKETIATIISDEEFIPVGEQEIIRQRKYLEGYISRDPLFYHSLDPYEVSDEAPEIVRRMAEAAAKVGVGPMASVAGAIAEYAVRAMVEAGASHVIVDNGGDIAMCIRHPVIIGIYAGNAEIKNIGLRFQPNGLIKGICTSSGTVGPSLSFGSADASTVIAKDVFLADAAATALGNSIKENSPKLIEEALNDLAVDGIDGMIAIKEDIMGMWGELPEIVKANVDCELITKG